MEFHFSTLLAPAQSTYKVTTAKKEASSGEIEREDIIQAFKFSREKG